MKSVADTHHKGWICHAFCMIPWKILSNTDLFADLQGSGAGYAVEAAEFADGGIVVDRDSAECIA